MILPYLFPAACYPFSPAPLEEGGAHPFCRQVAVFLGLCGIFGVCIGRLVACDPSVAGDPTRGEGAPLFVQCVGKPDNLLPCPALARPRALGWIRAIVTCESVRMVNFLLQSRDDR